MYFGIEIPDKQHLSYSLPPKFYEQIFDVRFSNDMRYVTEYGEINVISSSEMLEISFDIVVEAGEHMNWTLTSESGYEYILYGAGELVIPSEV